jgi:hypothetical protein
MVSVLIPLVGIIELDETQLRMIGMACVTVAKDKDLPV